LNSWKSANKHSNLLFYSLQVEWTIRLTSWLSSDKLLHHYRCYISFQFGITELQKWLFFMSAAKIVFKSLTHVRTQIVYRNQDCAIYVPWRRVKCKIYLHMSLTNSAYSVGSVVLGLSSQQPIGPKLAQILRIKPAALSLLDKICPSGWKQNHNNQL